MNKLVPEELALSKLGQGRVADSVPRPEYLPDSSMLNATVVKDNVNHPSHYNSGTIEVIDSIESVMVSMPNAPATWSGLTWQVLKYMMRWYTKNGLEDLRKAKWYLDRLIAKVESNSKE